MRRYPPWADAEHPTPGATPATPNCLHWGHTPGEWKYSCCACSGIPGGCSACETDWDCDGNLLHGGDA